jgi:AraC-like DNA-binding protein
MFKAGTEEKIYPAAKLATIVDALSDEGVSAADALEGTQISPASIKSPATRVSLNQGIECCRNASRLARGPSFAYRTGLRFHVSSSGMYGLAILSSTNFRQTLRFAEKYHELTMPLAAISFGEDREQAAWIVAPIAHPRVDATLYRFLVELQFGIHMSLSRDVWGSAFVARELHFTYGPPQDAQAWSEAFGCHLRFDQPENRFAFDAAWLDRTAEIGNEITYAIVSKLCCDEMEELQLRVGLAGKVREILLVNLMRPTSFDAAARHLHMTTRTLRRKLRAENISFRKLVDELRAQVAIRYLRDTDLTVEEIAYSLGFGDAANFRRAFRRWTGRGPLEFRNLARDISESDGTSRPAGAAPEKG